MEPKVRSRAVRTSRQKASLRASLVRAKPRPSTACGVQCRTHFPALEAPRTSDCLTRSVSLQVPSATTKTGASGTNRGAVSGQRRVIPKPRTDTSI